MRFNLHWWMLAVTLGAMAGVAYSQHSFTLGLSATENGPIRFGDGNANTVELQARPGQTVHVWFRAQFQPGYNGARRWAILNSFMDLERQYGDYSQAMSFTGFACDTCWVRHYGRIRANSVSPFGEPDNQFPLVTNDGVAGKILVTGGRDNSEPFVFARALLLIEPNACPRRYELCMTKIAGLDNNEEGIIIGRERVTVRTNFGVLRDDGSTGDDYGVRICATLEVLRPTNGDVNWDGCVNDVDLLRVMQAVGATGCSQEDLNGDGIVNDTDVVILLTNIGNC